MKRRTFLQASALASLGMLGFNVPGKTHVLSLSFDDGFKKSFYRIAEIHEEYGLKACLNVIATGHFPDFDTNQQWIPRKLLGNFDDWNAFKSRGHELMPHSWKHLNLTEIPLAEAKANIDKCFDYFEQHLEGYRPEEAVYNFAYNASTRELEEYALRRVKAVRTGGWFILKDTMVNLLPAASAPKPTGRRTLGCWSHGPDFTDTYIEQEVNKFLATEGGWLILNLHGLDEEGWGPTSTDYLDSLLRRLTKINHLAVLPTGRVISN